MWTRRKERKSAKVGEREKGRERKMSEELTATAATTPDFTARTRDLRRLHLAAGNAPTRNKATLSAAKCAFRLSSAAS